MAHLWIAITAHGYGHLAQIAPLVAALHQQRPSVRITLQSTLPLAVIRSRISAPFTLVDQPADVALPMDNPLQVRWRDGLALYEAFERDYPQHLARQQARLAADPPTVLLADVPWMPLEAAHKMQLPAVGLCSLNWYDILLHSPVGGELSAALSQRLQRVYQQADLFLRPAPSMPMPWLNNAVAIGPLAAQRPRRADDWRQRLGIAAETRLLLMQFGGTGHLTLSGAVPAGWQILTPDVNISPRPGIHHIAADEVLDALASVDALLTKPGYGAFAEAACHGIPVIYVRRDDWAETPHLVTWLAAQQPTAVLEDLTTAALEQALTAVLAQPRPSPLAPTGIAETLAYLEPWLA